jgi:Ca-activated chloride channel family protein
VFATNQPRTVCSLLLVALSIHALPAAPQTSAPDAQNPTPYRLRVAVDEVVVTFSAADARGLPINDLRLDELTLLDNGKPPRKIVAFQPLRDRPIRAGFLMDKSQSIDPYLTASRAIAAKYTQRLLRQQTDQAFVMDFASLSAIAQPWTSNPAAITAGLRAFTNVRNGIAGTAVFDAVYRTCLGQFGHIEHTASGNFILLFSDGEDNASHATLKDAIDECQRANTAIYAFRSLPGAGFFSSGTRTLADLASQSGGHFFIDEGSDAAIDDDLRLIEADLRNQYRLIYKPADFRHDGSFHRIELTAPVRVDRIGIRIGYYAPSH